HRDLDREPTRAQHAALHVLRQVAQVRVAAGHLAPAVEDPDHGPAGERLLGEALHPELRQMPDAVEGARVPPGGAAKGPFVVSRHVAALRIRLARANSSYDMPYGARGEGAVPVV